MKRSTLIFIFLLSVAINEAEGLQVEVTSTVTPTKASLGEFLALTVKASGSDAGKAGAPMLETMPDFTIIGPPLTRSETNITNFKIFVSKSYTYTLKPNKTGTYKIGAVTFKAGREKFSAPAIKVEIVAGSIPKVNPGQKADEKSSINSENIKGNQDTFIRAYVDDEEPYLGDQITYTFELNNSRALLANSEYNPPLRIGFWAVDLPKIPVSTRMIGKRLYQTNTIKTALFPTTTGELTIGEAQLTYRSGGFWSPLQVRNISTDPITIRVKPLPEEGKPSDFDGVVGNFDISSKIDKQTSRIDEVITVKITVTGEGNLDLITSLGAPSFSAFKTYDPKVAETILNSGFVVGGAKTWEYVLIPIHQGEMTLGSFSLSFFNPEDESYHTVLTEPIELKILPGNESAFTRSTRGISRRVIENIASDIHYVKPDKKILKSTQKQIYSHFTFYLLYVVPFLSFVMVFGVKKRRDTIEKNTGLKRRLNAWKNAQKRLSDASLMIKNNRKLDFCGKLSEAVIIYIGDRLNIDTGTQTSTSLENVLKRNGITSELAERIRKTLDLCDFVQFSSAGSGHEAQENLLKDTRDILTSLKETL
ncbi:MAG: protein BatD [Candidatus Latescibacteria bacterium]|nr:protein BatD [Candidatus Latescibacterota bacterium]